ncbi:MAG TPA: hypothetical protein VMW27_25010 [Thermoanaerobaculia bacterium]|nr:hypothetical protein [Thermoanaerobaculia bacterium]
MKRSTALIALAFLLAALPAAAADVIGRGIDPWTTVPTGTYADLRDNPIPAGFFCAQSQPFSGRIWLRGVPLASDQKAALGTTDTIVERLDDAVFNKRGVARTRVKVRALQLIGIEPFRTACGEYFVHVELDSEQPTSLMRIFRDDDKGGRYQVDLRVHTRLVFTRVDNSAERLELADPVTLPTSPYARWGYRQAIPNAKRVGTVMVDTNWDGTPDTLLPGTSNFSPGRGARFGGKIIAQDHASLHMVEN